MPEKWGEKKHSYQNMIGFKSLHRLAVALSSDLFAPLKNEISSPVAFARMIHYGKQDSMVEVRWLYASK